MQSIALFAYALAVGLTLCGLAGSAIEIASGRRLGFRAPFVSRDRFGASLAMTLAVGPFMLANEALAAYRVGAIDMLALTLCGVAATAWAMATGVVVVELALVLPNLLG